MRGLKEKEPPGNAPVLVPAADLEGDAGLGQAVVSAAGVALFRHVRHPVRGPVIGDEQQHLPCGAAHRLARVLDDPLDIVLGPQRLDDPLVVDRVPRDDLVGGQSVLVHRIQRFF
jgi:hypothetical protein